MRLSRVIPYLKSRFISPANVSLGHRRDRWGAIFPLTTLRSSWFAMKMLVPQGFVRLHPLSRPVPLRAAEICTRLRNASCLVLLVVRGATLSWDPDVIGRGNLDIFQCGGYIDALQPGLLLRGRLENQVILIVQNLLQTIKVRLEANQILISKREIFSAGLLSNLRHAPLTELHFPAVAAHASDSSSVNSMNNYAVALGCIAGGARVCTDARHSSGHTGWRSAIVAPGGGQVLDVGRPLTSQPVNTVGDHQDFTTDFLLWPTLDQTDQRQVGTIHGGQTSARQTDGLGRRGMIGSEILHDLDRRVRHITDPDQRCRGLGVDKIPNIVEAVSDAGVAGVVNQNKKLKRGIVTAGRNQVVHLDRRLSLLNLHVLRAQDRNFAVAANRFVCDDHVNLDGAGSLRVNRPHSESQRTQCNKRSQQKLVTLHASSLNSSYRSFAPISSESSPIRTTCWRSEPPHGSGTARTSCHRSLVSNPTTSGRGFPRRFRTWAKTGPEYPTRKPQSELSKLPIDAPKKTIANKSASAADAHGGRSMA